MINSQLRSYSRWTFLVLFGAVLFLSYKIAASFIVSVLMGGLLAHALRPLQRSPGLNSMTRVRSAVVILGGLILVVVLPLVLFTINVIQQGIEFKKFLALYQLPDFNFIIDTVRSLPIVSFFIDDSLQIQNQVQAGVTMLSGKIGSLAMYLASEIPSLLVQLIVILASGLVFLIDGEKFYSWLSDRIPLEGEIKKALIRSFSVSSKSAVWATLAASAAQTSVIFTGFVLLGVQGAFLAAGVTFVFAFIPFLGATPVWVLGALYLYFQGSMIKFVFMIVFGIAATLSDNVARAFVLKGPQGLHPLVGVIAVFGGMQVFGFFGVLIGPIIVAVLITLCEVWPRVWES